MWCTRSGNVVFVMSYSYHRGMGSHLRSSARASLSTNSRQLTSLALTKYRALGPGGSFEDILTDTHSYPRPVLPLSTLHFQGSHRNMKMGGVLGVRSARCAGPSPHQNTPSVRDGLAIRSCRIGFPAPLVVELVKANDYEVSSTLRLLLRTM